MGKSIVVEYKADSVSAVKAVTSVVARLGYTLGQVDKENGIVTFETGISMNSWAGQKMSAHIFSLDDGIVQITISGNMKAHGAQIQVYDWGEAGKIATKVFDLLDEVLGKGNVLQGKKDSGACFIATAVYQDYDHPQVLKFRRFRDTQLKPRFFGRAFIWVYYKIGPILACAPKRSKSIRKALKWLMDQV